MKIGSSIRKIRKQLELSQDAVIKNCKLPISQATLSKIENGTIDIDINSPRLVDIATAMGVHPSQIECYEDNFISGSLPAENHYLPNATGDMPTTVSDIINTQLKQQAIIEHLMAIIERLPSVNNELT